MDRVSKEVCSHCIWYAEYINTEKNWICRCGPHRARETIYGDFSKPPKHCPYKNQTKDEALAEIILRKLTNETL